MTAPHHHLVGLPRVQRSTLRRLAAGADLLADQMTRGPIPEVEMNQALDGLADLLAQVRAPTISSRNHQ